MYIYEKRWVVADGTALVVPANEAVQCFALKFPDKGSIRKFVVRQGDLPTYAFVVDLFNTPVAPMGYPGSESSVVPEEIDDTLARILPQQSATAGAAVAVYSDTGYAYRNMINAREIYVRINVTSPTTESLWEVQIAVEPFSGG